jgi:uncharacterized protein (UPF0261 family)
MLFRAAHANTGASPVQRKRYPGTKSAKNLNMTDLVEAIGKIPLKTDMKTKSSEFSNRSKKTSPQASNDDIATNGHSAVAAAIFSKTDRKKQEIQFKAKT